MLELDQFDEKLEKLELDLLTNITLLMNFYLIYNYNIFVNK